MCIYFYYSLKPLFCLFCLSELHVFHLLFIFEIFFFTCLKLKCIFVVCVQGVIAEVPEIILRCVSRDEAALAVAQKVCFLLLGSVCWWLTYVKGCCLAILVAYIGC